MVKGHCKFLIKPDGRQHKQLGKHVEITNKNIFNNREIITYKIDLNATVEFQKFVANE